MGRLLVSVGGHDMGFPRLLDNPLYGNHGPLIMGWSDDQLKPLVDRLAPLLPDKLTDQMRLAIASIARSIVAEKKLTGWPVHYARAKEPYGTPNGTAAVTPDAPGITSPGRWTSSSRPV